MTAKIALIPARGGSTGIFEKNLRVVGKLSLVQRAVVQAQRSQCFDEVVVSTDHSKIREQAEALGATCQDRPEEFRHDNTVQEVDRLLVHMIREWEASRNKSVDIAALVYPTAPLRKINTIIECMEQVKANRYDSCLTLHKDHSYLWMLGKQGQVKPINYDPKERGPRQKENWNQWVENKAVYTFKADLFKETGCRIVGRCGYVEVTENEGIDIDKHEDLDRASWLLSSGRYLDDLA